MLDLTTYWLTENQSLVYQKWLQIWVTTVTKLSRATKMNRVLVYNTLQELLKKWLTTCVMKGNVGWYTMVSPDFLKEKLLQKVNSFEALIPQLKSTINTQWGGMSVQFFQWREWIKALYNEISESTTDLKAFLWIDHMDDELREHLYTVYLPKRLGNGITSHTIVSKTDMNEYFSNPENVPNTEVRLIDDVWFDLDCEIILFNENKISLATLWSDEIGWLLITSSKLYDSLENLFDWIWKRI